MRRDKNDMGRNLFEGDGTSSASAHVNVPTTQLRLDDEEVSITLRRAWDRALRMLSQRVNKPTFETHLRGLKPLAFAEEVNERGQVVRRVTVGAPSAFTRSWVEGRHAPLIREILEEIFDGTVILEFALTPKEGDSGQGSGLRGSSVPAPPSRPTTSTSPLPLDLGTDDISQPIQRQATAQGKVERLGTSWETSREELPNAETVASQLSNTDTQKPIANAYGQDQAVRPVAERRTVQTPPSTTVRTSSSPPTRNEQNTSSSADHGSQGTNQRHPDAPEINPRFTFDKFIVGPTNRLAHGGAFAVATSPGERYNPLFLYGPPGLGKTHLLHAIANAQIQKTGNAKPRIAYMSGEAFTAQYVTSLRQQKAEEFRRRLKSVDLWLVDDIQFIAGKEHTKEEFFHTFNALQSAGKQIVICSDRSPRELRAMDERLQSRFESGLVADIAPPDLETRLAILQKKAENESTRVPDDVLLYMARLVQSNIRTLEGALVKLVAYASLMNSPVTTQMAEGILERYFIAAGAGEIGNHGATTAFSMPMPTPKGDPLGGATFSGTAGDKRQPTSFKGTEAGTAPTASTSTIKLTPELIRNVVAKRFNVPLDELNGKRRDRDVTNARQVAMHLLRELTDISLPGIGQLFGGRDHTTVIHACDRIKSQIGMDDEMRFMVEGILEEMGSPVALRDQTPPARHVGQTFEQGLFNNK